MPLSPCHSFHHPPRTLPASLCGLLVRLFALLALSPAPFLSACSKPDDHGPVVLRFWYAWGGYEGKFLVSLVDEFNRTHPRIRVEPAFYNIGDKLLASIAGGKPPDVATIWDFMLVTMGESGCFLPLEGRLAGAGITPDSFLPNVWDYGQYGDHKWGVPTTLNAWGLYVNRKVVRDAGLEPDHPPRTTDDLTRWNRELTVFDTRGTLQRAGSAPQMPLIWIWNFGGDIFDRQTKTYTLDRPENVEAFAWMAEQYKTIGLDNWRRFEAGFGRLDSPQNPFFVGKMALREDGQWVMQFIHEFAPDLDYSIAPFPTKSGHDIGFSQMSGSFWAIPTGTKHPEEAWEFLRWLISPPQSARFCARLRNIPPLRETLQHPDFAETLKDDKFRFFVDLFLKGKVRPIPATPVTQQLTETFVQALDPVYAGRQDPREFLTRLNVDINKRLQRELQFIGGEEKHSPTSEAPAP